MKRKQWFEKRLTRRIANGKEDACIELVRAYNARIFGFLLHMCRDRQFAEDITQETFAAAWAKIGSFNGASSLATWLHRIAYNKFVDWQRRNKYSAIDAAENLLFNQESGDQDPLDALLVDEQSRCLSQAVARLDTVARETIVMHYFQELSYREIAKVLDKPAGTIKWRTRQALAQLKALMEARTENESE